jgi:hypothetical protein
MMSLPEEIEARYPGIAVGPQMGLRVNTENGDRAWLQFLWLAPDSSVTDLSQIDMAKRADLLVTAQAYRDRGFFRIKPTVIPVRFGEPGVGEVQALSPLNPVDLHLPPGVRVLMRGVQVQVTAVNVGANTVDLQLRIRSLKRGSPAPEPNDWLPESQTVRVGYGQSAEVQMDDGSQQPLHLTLAAEHLVRTNAEVRSVSEP